MSEKYTGLEEWKNFELDNNEMRFKIIQIGQVERYTDDTYAFLEQGKKLTLRRRGFFGLEFVLMSNEIYEVELGVKVHFPDGTDEETTMKIKNNVPHMICQGFLHEHHMMDGEWTLEARVKDRIYNNNETEISVFDDISQEFKIKCIKPEIRLANNDDINDVEVMYSTTLRDDYKAFLKEHNGYNFNWWLHNDLAEHVKMIGDKEMRKTAKLPSDREDKEWIDDVNELFGANTEKFTDLIPATGEPYDHFYDAAFGKFFYPIGKDGGGNAMVQIAKGKHKGKVGMLDHETYHGGMDNLVTREDVEDLDIPFDDLTTADADTVIDYCEEVGFLGIYNESFSDYFARRTAIIEKKKGIVKNTFQMMIPTEGGANNDMDALMNMDFAEVEIKKVGAFEQDGDNYKLKEKGKKLKLKDADYVGILFKIKSKKDDLQMAKCSITMPSGETIESELQAKPNDLSTLVVKTDETGEYSFKVKFPDNMMLETLKQKIKVK